MKTIRKILFNIVICIFAGLIAIPNGMAASNLSVGDIGDYGSWATDSNKDIVLGNMRTDLDYFENQVVAETLVPEYVPIEAKVGLAFMNALSVLTDVLDAALMRFALVFIILAYAMWAMFEAYNMMTTTSDVRQFAETLVKKGAVILIWFIILDIGPAKLFMMIAGPIVMVGSYLCDLILNAVSTTYGAEIPNTCAAIEQYVIEHGSTKMLLDSGAVSQLLCIPTRLSGFFYTGVAAGFKWMGIGLGTSALTFITGALFVYFFIASAFKFAFLGFGVIADLFLALLMLPFTAISETITKTSYKGIAGTIFNGFLNIFKPDDLSSVINKFVKATIYFVSLSVVVALCGALLSGVIKPDLATQVPTLKNMSTYITLLTGLLVWHIANEADTIAKNIGTAVDNEAQKWANSVKSDVVNWSTAVYKETKKFIDIFRKKK